MSRPGFAAATVIAAASLVVVRMPLVTTTR